MYIFGGMTRGYNSCEFLQDLWALDLPSLKWHLLPASPGQPCARTGHAAAVHSDKMWVFGGFAQMPDKSKLLMSGLLCFDFTKRAWAHAVTVPSREPIPDHEHEPPVPEVVRAVEQGKSLRQGWVLHWGWGSYGGRGGGGAALQGRAP